MVTWVAVSADNVDSDDWAVAGPWSRVLARITGVTATRLWPLILRLHTSLMNTPHYCYHWLSLLWNINWDQDYEIISTSHSTINYCWHCQLFFKSTFIVLQQLQLFIFIFLHLTLETTILFIQCKCQRNIAFYIFMLKYSCSIKLSFLWL